MITLSRKDKKQYTQLVKRMNALTTALVTRPIHEYDAINIQLQASQKAVEEFLKPFDLNLSNRHLIK